MTATRLKPPPATLADTFSLYVPSRDTATLGVVESVADAVTVKGSNGPTVVRELRRNGWDTPVVFDRAGYDGRTQEIEPERWFDDQASAGADRLLTAGTWVAWGPDDANLARAIEVEAARCDGRPEVTAVFAIDHRWLTKRPMDLADALTALGRPAALVPAHQADPLGQSNAVHGLIALTRNVNDLSILRTDHGGIGALAHGARHAAIGLIGSYRHFVPPGVSGRGKTDDRSPRLFVRPLMDWFTAATIAGWTTDRVNLRCHLECCRGQGLDRFFDPRHDAEAVIHNRFTLKQLADDILDAPTHERAHRFRQLCLEALDHYGPMGKLSMITEPKLQLNQWALA